jgi:hypothetical protein
MGSPSSSTFLPMVRCDLERRHLGVNSMRPTVSSGFLRGRPRGRPFAVGIQGSIQAMKSRQYDSPWSTPCSNLATPL